MCGQEPPKSSSKVAKSSPRAAKSDPKAAKSGHLHRQTELFWPREASFFKKTNVFLHPTLEGTRGPPICGQEPPKSNQERSKSSSKVAKSSPRAAKSSHLRRQTELFWPRETSFLEKNNVFQHPTMEGTCGRPICGQEPPKSAQDRPKSSSKVAKRSPRAAKSDPRAAKSSHLRRPDHPGP